jgi:hypothetical protein
MSLSTVIQARVSGTQTSALDLGTSTFAFVLSDSMTLATGTGENMADAAFTDSRTLAASANEDLDLAGVLLDAAGSIVTMATLKFVMIKADAANTNNVIISRPASNGVPLFAAAGDAIAIKPGGCFMWLAPETGVAVTPGTGDLINIANSGAGTSVAYDVVMIGTTA